MMSLVSHDWLELLVRILHVAQTEVEAIHKGLVVEAAIGRKHVKGIVVLQWAKPQGAFPWEHSSRAGLTLQAGEHKLLGIGGKSRGLLLLLTEAQSVQ